MVKIENNDPNNNNNLNNIDDDDLIPTKEDEEELKEREQSSEPRRYQIDKRELTFPQGNMKNARIVPKSEQGQQQKEVPPTKEVPLQKEQIITPEQRQMLDLLERLPYEENDIKFIHLPDDPAYQPISLELIKMNEFQNEDLKLNTRIMFNVALSDYVIFRLIDDNSDKVENVKVYFKRVKRTQMAEYIDIQTELDDLVRRVGLVEMTRPFTMELQDQLFDYQKKLIAVSNKRLEKGFEMFFSLTEEQKKQFDDFDTNDITFNVDSAFIRITKSPFLRRKLSHST